MVMYGFIIEHPTKGVLVSIPGDVDEKFHFSWSKLRSDDSTRVFPTLGRARAQFDNRNLPAGCEIRKYGTWEVVRWEVVK